MAGPQGGRACGQYEIEQFLDACIDGDQVRIRVRWVGYESDEDTWELEHELRQSQPQLVESFVRERVDRGLGHPPRCGLICREHVPYSDAVATMHISFTALYGD